jgi:hypothetical protein
MKNKQTQQSGFITLFFVLGISFTFLTWISLSSEMVFEYIHIKGYFMKNRDSLNNTVLCADSFVENFINSKYNLDFVEDEYSFYRGLSFKDDYICQIKGINVIYQGNGLHKIFFILDDFSFEYGFEYGFVKYIKTLNIL